MTMGATWTPSMSPGDSGESIREPRPPGPRRTTPSCNVSELATGRHSACGTVFSTPNPSLDTQAFILSHFVSVTRGWAAADESCDWFGLRPVPKAFVPVAGQKPDL